MVAQKQYENAKIIAVYAQSAWSGLACYGFEYGADDYAIIALVYNGKEADHKRKYKIYASAKGLYIMWRGHRYYLSDFIRTDIGS